MVCDHYFTNRLGGVSKGCYGGNNLATHVKDDIKDVLQNRQNLATEFNLAYLQFMNQVHGSEIAHITQPIKAPTCDGLMTNIPNIALVVLVADCTPLLLYDEKNSAIAALHVGRSGAFLNIITKAIGQMQEHFHTKPKDVQAFVGAGIGQCCYKIGGKVLEEAKTRFKKHLKDDYLDIHGIIQEQLRKLHIEKVQINHECTKCHQQYFSYRRDGVTGRQAGIITLRS